jgi:hypothetical protein
VAPSYLARPNELSDLLKKKIAHLSACLFPEEPISLILRVSFRFVPQNSLFLRHRRPVSPLPLNHRLPAYNGARNLCVCTAFRLNSLARASACGFHEVRQSCATIRGMLIEADAMVRRLLRYAQNGAIFCLHDGRSGAPPADIRPTIEAASRLISDLSARGCRFETVSQILCPTT